MNKKQKLSRIDPAFEQDMKELARIRVSKGLAKMNPKSVSVREMTNLLKRTKGYRISVEELKNLPKKDDK